jgi:hypothetical protein
MDKQGGRRGYVDKLAKRLAKIPFELEDRKTKTKNRGNAVQSRMKTGTA